MPPATPTASLSVVATSLSKVQANSRNGLRKLKAVMNVRNKWVDENPNTVLEKDVRHFRNQE